MGGHQRRERRGAFLVRALLSPLLRGHDLEQSRMPLMRDEPRKRSRGADEGRALSTCVADLSFWVLFISYFSGTNASSQHARCSQAGGHTPCTEMTSEMLQFVTE